MERIRKSFIGIVLIILVLFVESACSASQIQTLNAQDKLKQVALFKNGLGFFVSEVTIPDGMDSFSITPSVAASHGSFWISYPPEVKLDSLIAKEIESEELVDAVTIFELLKANIGRKARLNLSGKEKEVDGVIKYIAEDREIPKVEPYVPGSVDARTNRGYGNLIQSSLMIIETDAGEICIKPQNVYRIEFLGGKAEKTFARKSKTMQLDIKMSAPAIGKKLTLSYLAKGITWAPSYMVDITKSDKLRISAKAVVINEACDLDGVTVQLVTGFPNLQFADIVSPLAMKENLSQFLQSLIRGQSEQGISAGVMSQKSNYSGSMGSSSVFSMEMPGYGQAKAGKAAEDLFLYPVENVNLAKGQVIYLPLFTESVPYKHIYQWKIPDYINKDERYSYPVYGQGNPESKEKVWHCLKLENTTKIPWTTAPAEIVKEGLILGQDTLYYTPAQGETTLRITQAVSVKAEQVELETERKRDAAQLYGRHYDLVTVEGKLSVTNFQKKAITLEITKTLSGEVKSFQPEAKIEKLASGLRRMNGVGTLTWTIELKPGEQKKLGYIYDVYVRR